MPVSGKALTLCRIADLEAIQVHFNPSFVAEGSEAITAQVYLLPQLS